jgi:hypothetical protein
LETAAMLTMVKGDTFRLWAPFELAKGGTDSDPLRGKIQGVASSEKRDNDGDVVRQDGIDWSMFKSNGFFVYEHPFRPPAIVGQPSDIERVEVDGLPATRVTGHLYLEDPLGKSLWQKANVLQKASDDRRFGFSVEGAIMRRHPERHWDVTHSKVHTVAITPFPKNEDSWFEPLAASMLAGLVPLLRAEYMGYPAQGEAAVGAGGLGKIATQSLQGAKGRRPSRTYSFSAMDKATVVVLRQFPQWSWAQGRAVAKELMKKLKNFKELAR